MSGLCDTHCHLTFPPLAQGLAGVLARSREAGVVRWLVPAYDLADWAKVEALEGTPGLMTAYGLHPWAADQPLDPAALAARLARPAVRGVGEIGLDYKVAGADRARQQSVLAMQLELAVAKDLPVLLHCRGAFEDLAALLRPYRGRLRGVLHAFSRGPETLAPFLDLGLHVAFGGALTRPQARQARRSAMQVPIERLLVETDAPSIALEEVPAREVEPAHARRVAACLAELRGLDFASLVERLEENENALFGRPTTPAL